MEISRKLPQALLPWYDENKRQLPWRQDKDPYHIWLSEIMLQQTRVEAVKGYYHRFLQQIPNIETLAKVDDDTLYKLWEGLGYYSRCRNLKKAANVIQEQFRGKFPERYEDILSLPGVGEYTAGAVASIAFDQKTPAVDGNVLRLVARLNADPTPIDNGPWKQKVRQSLAQIYPQRAGDFTQALMELGATICGPNRQPDCPLCPCRDFCRGYAQGHPETYPVKPPKKQKRVEEKTVFILSCNGKYALHRRDDKGLLAGLWEFPNIDSKLTAEQALSKVEEFGLHAKDILQQVERNHIFTHIIWQMNGIYVEVKELGGDFTWLTPEQIEKSASLPTAFRQFWEVLNHV